MSKFHTQGAVPLDSPAYVERAFERNVLAQLLNQNWVLLLGPREHGKSSGIARIKAQLVDEGLDVITLDLQTLPPYSSYHELLAWVAIHAARGLGSEVVAQPTGDDAKQLVKWLEAAIPDGDSPIVVIVDEAANISNDEYRNAFYGQIRGISTARGEAASRSILKRLRFLFTGMFRPESMVHPSNSPFNVCELVYTEDLTLAQAQQLVTQVLSQEEEEGRTEIDSYIEEAYQLVGGQPYLLQNLLSKTLQTASLDREVAFNNALDELKYNDMHTSALLSRVLADSAVARIAARLAAEGELPMLPGDNDYKFICVLGLAMREGPVLKFRNELYAGIARSSPQLRPGEAVPNSGALIVALPEDAFNFMKDAQLKEFTISAQRGAAKAFNAGSYRLALVGFGSALESLLIDWLQTVPAADLTAAVGRATDLSFNKKFEDSSDPSTWRLVNLMKVSREVPAPLRNVDPPEPLREFRNTVHPKAAIKTGLGEEELRPEAEAASGFFNIVLRDIKAVMSKP